jgi:peptidoglycan/xylan/chitin deacetylase (PgdA/CDA1 family)
MMPEMTSEMTPEMSSKITSEPSIVFLMYHELKIPGRALCRPEPGYARYAISENEFRDQMQHLKESGYKGASVGRALEFSTGKCVAITFDDGTETDLLAAAPLLQKAGFNATFYITSGWLGQPGHLSPAQLNELSRQGFEIGCHSTTHARLIELDHRGLQFETADAKTRLEQIIGKSVDHFSCPGGGYNARVAKAAQAAGFRTVATSRIHANTPRTDVFALGRVPILRRLPIAEFAGICTGEALPRLRAGSGVRHAAKRLLGSALYERVRNALLRRQDQAHED